MQVILTEEEYNALKADAELKKGPDYVQLQQSLQLKIMEIMEGFEKGFEQVVNQYGSEFALDPYNCMKKFIQEYKTELQRHFIR